MPDGHGNGRPPEVNPKGVRILVIEDHADYARVLVRFLGLAGHEAVSACLGPEAVEPARRFRPGFVLLDVGAPGVRGYELASRLRLEGGCKETVLIAASDDGREERRRRSN